MNDLEDDDNFEDYEQYDEILRHHRDNQDVERNLFNMPDRIFVSNFRFSKEEVVRLIDLIRYNIAVNIGNQRHSPEFQVNNRTCCN